MKRSSGSFSTVKYLVHGEERVRCPDEGDFPRRLSGFFSCWRSWALVYRPCLRGLKKEIQWLRYERFVLGVGAQHGPVKKLRTLWLHHGINKWHLLRLKEQAQLEPWVGRCFMVSFLIVPVSRESFHTVIVLAHRQTNHPKDKIEVGMGHMKFFWK